MSKTTIDASTISRFWDKVDISSDTSCWNWKGAKTPRGYGTFRFGKMEYAHRVAFYLNSGKWPTLNVCHHCDNPSCVNPNHLWEGTQLQNIKDCINKGRSKPVFGEYHGGRKLSIEDAVFIYLSKEDGDKLSKRLNISESVISQIRNGKKWVKAIKQYFDLKEKTEMSKKDGERKQG